MFPIKIPLWNRLNKKKRSSSKARNCHSTVFIRLLHWNLHVFVSSFFLSCIRRSIVVLQEHTHQTHYTRINQQTTNETMILPTNKTLPTKWQIKREKHQQTFWHILQRDHALNLLLFTPFNFAVHSFFFSTFSPSCSICKTEHLKNGINHSSYVTLFRFDIVLTFLIQIAYTLTQVIYLLFFSLSTKAGSFFFSLFQREKNPSVLENEITSSYCSFIAA